MANTILGHRSTHQSSHVTHLTAGPKCTWGGNNPLNYIPLGPYLTALKHNKEASRLYAELYLWVLWLCLFGSKVFSVSNELTLSALGSSSFLINLHEL